MSAVRVARGVTGRDRVVKFAGCYHGHADGLLAGGGSGVATLGPARLGRRAGRGGGRHRGGALQRGARARRVGGLRDRRAGGGQHEPGAPGRGVLGGAAGRACDAVGALLVFDEVITGFRLGPGGAAARYGVTPGPVVLRQGDRRAACPSAPSAAGPTCMAVLAPGGPVYQAGTLSGNPLATAAGLAVLGPRDAGRLRGADRPGGPVRRRPGRRPPAGGLSAAAPVAGPLVGLYVAAPGTAVGPAAATTTSGRPWPATGSTPGCSTPSSAGGWRWPPGPYEVLFPGLAHGEQRSGPGRRGGRAGRSRGGDPPRSARTRRPRWWRVCSMSWCHEPGPRPTGR